MSMWLENSFEQLGQTSMSPLCGFVIMYHNWHACIHYMPNNACTRKDCSGGREISNHWSETLSLSDILLWNIPVRRYFQMKCQFAGSSESNKGITLSFVPYIATLSAALTVPSVPSFYMIHVL